MKAAELVVACFLLFGACLVWPLLAIVLVGALLARRARPPEDEP